MQPTLSFETEEDLELALHSQPIHAAVGQRDQPEPHLQQRELYHQARQQVTGRSLCDRGDEASADSTRNHASHARARSTKCQSGEHLVCVRVECSVSRVWGGVFVWVDVEKDCVSV